MTLFHKILKGLIPGLMLLLFFNPSLQADEPITLNFAKVDIHSEFYYSLLREALSDAGYVAQINVVELPAKRAKLYLQSGGIDIMNMLRSSERDSLYIPVPVGLTDGLIGSRVLIIPAGSASDFAGVKTLDDFRNLHKVVGMGEDWFDVDVWKANELPVLEFSGDYSQLFKMLAAKNRGIDYYSTGFNEALDEINTFGNLGLEIEPHLMLVYQRDFIFYLNPRSAEKYFIPIDKAMKEARDSGLISRKVREYWHNDMEKLHYDQRLKIYLKTPR